MNRLPFALLCALALPCAAAGPELVEVRKIWDAGKHNAFTDLLRWRGQWWCTFREGDDHVGGDGKARVLVSSDGERWRPAALIAEEGIDLRDPKICVTPDDRLMLVMGGSVYGGTKVLKGRHPRVVFSADGAKWSAPQRVLSEGEWLWRAMWYEGTCYALSYNASLKPRTLKLFTSTNGVDYELRTQLDTPNVSGEATMRFLKSGEVAMLVRCNGGGHIGFSKPPLREWTWQPTDYQLGGPNFIELPDGRLIAGSRLWPGGTKTTGKAQFALFEMSRAGLKPILTLPSGGDCSYPGLVWHDGLLWVSYYSSHEGKSSIYVAKVKLPPAN